MKRKSPAQVLPVRFHCENDRRNLPATPSNLERFRRNGIRLRISRRESRTFEQKITPWSFGKPHCRRFSIPKVLLASMLANCPGFRSPNQSRGQAERSTVELSPRFASDLVTFRQSPESKRMPLLSSGSHQRLCPIFRALRGARGSISALGPAVVPPGNVAPGIHFFGLDRAPCTQASFSHPKPWRRREFRQHPRPLHQRLQRLRAVRARSEPPHA